MRKALLEFEPADDVDPADRQGLRDLTDDYLAQFDAADAEPDPARREAMQRAILMDIGDALHAGDEAKKPWYEKVFDAFAPALGMVVVAVVALVVLVEPWGLWVAEGALLIAVVFALHALRILSALRRALPVLLAMAAVFIFGQVAVRESWQQPFIFWPVVISVGTVVARHDLSPWVLERWREWREWRARGR